MQITSSRARRGDTPTPRVTGRSSVLVLVGAVLLAAGGLGAAQAAPTSAVTDAPAATVRAVTAAPEIVSLSERSGPTAGGTSVYVAGDTAGATAVLFDGAPGTDLAVDALGQLTVTTPPHPGGTVVVTLVTPGGSSVAQGGAYPVDTFTFSDAPVLRAVTPETGPSAGGTVVTLLGSGFGGGTDATVSFGGTEVTVVAGDDGRPTATAPAHPEGPVDLVVRTAAGSSAPVGHTYTDAPVVTVLNPATGPVSGGTRTTLFGLRLDGATRVDFGGAPGTDVVVAADGASLTVTTPAHDAGEVTVVVTTPEGTSSASGGPQLQPCFTLG